MASKNDFGIKLSQPAIEISQAGDKDLLFSSSFPLLKEEKSGVYNAPPSSVGNAAELVYEHKLNYYPFFLVFDSAGEMVLGPNWSVSANGLFARRALEEGRYFWVVYRLDIFKAFDAGQVDVGTAPVGGYSPDFGLKISKEGKDVDSDDLRDFTLHSRGRSPLLSLVDVKQRNSAADDAPHTVSHGLPYNPICFGFVQNDVTQGGRAYNMESGGQGVPLLSREANGDITIDTLFTVGSLSSIIIFKDPFLAPKLVGVAY